jgi:hypothetical protein
MNFPVKTPKRKMTSSNIFIVGIQLPVDRFDSLNDL